MRITYKAVPMENNPCIAERMPVVTDEEPLTDDERIISYIIPDEPIPGQCDDYDISQAIPIEGIYDNLREAGDATVKYIMDHSNDFPELEEIDKSRITPKTLIPDMSYQGGAPMDDGEYEFLVTFKYRGEIVKGFISWWGYLTEEGTADYNYPECQKCKHYLQDRTHWVYRDSTLCEIDKKPHMYFDGCQHSETFEKLDGWETT